MAAEFGALKYFHLMWLPLVLVLLLVWTGRLRKAASLRFAEAGLLARLGLGVSVTRRRWKAALVVLAVAMSVVALAKPRLGADWEEVTRQGIDIVAVIDTSRSMLAKDVHPNRMDMGKRELLDLLRVLEGDRLGVVTFAGTSYPQGALTLDYSYCRELLEDIDTSIMPQGGSAIGEAIDTALKMFRGAGGKHRAILLISDGEDLGGKAIAAAERARDAGVPIFCLGIGTEKGAPIKDETGAYIKYKGDRVFTKLDENTLMEMAQTTGGAYVRAVPGMKDIQALYGDHIAAMEKKELATRKARKYHERFQWPLLAAFLVLAIEGLISERSRMLAKEPV